MPSCQEQLRRLLVDVSDWRSEMAQAMRAGANVVFSHRPLTRAELESALDNLDRIIDAAMAASADPELDIPPELAEIDEASIESLRDEVQRELGPTASHAESATRRQGGVWERAESDPAGKQPPPPPPAARQPDPEAARRGGHPPPMLVEHHDVPVTAPPKPVERPDLWTGELPADHAERATGHPQRLTLGRIIHVRLDALTAARASGGVRGAGWYAGLVVEAESDTGVVVQVFAPGGNDPMYVACSQPGSSMDGTPWRWPPR